MKNYDLRIEHLYENGNIDETTGYLCLYVNGKGRKNRFHEHEFYEFFLALNPIVHYINGKTEKLDRGSFVFIKPSDIHGIVYEECKEGDIINLSFSTRIMEGILNYLCLTKTAVDNIMDNCISLSEADTISLFKKMKNIVNGDKANVLQTRILILEMFAMFLKDKSLKSDIPEWFDDMCNQMKKTENYSVGAQRMIDISGKSREYISRCMRKYLGISVTEFVNDIRLSFVAAQLVGGNKSITELCNEAGFYSVSWFNKIFLKKYGMPPKEMRKSGKYNESIDF